MNRMTALRAIVIALGVLVLAVGALLLGRDLDASRMLGLATWLVAALVLHDAVLAPLVFLTDRLLRRVGRRIPVVVLLIVQGAVFVAALMTAIVVPEILKQRIGSPNDTILTVDYGRNLAIFYAALAVATAAAIAGYLAARRAKQRASISQS